MQRENYENCVSVQIYEPNFVSVCVYVYTVYIYLYNIIVTSIYRYSIGNFVTLN